jgi:sulfate transport system ATP-binding protein
MTPSTLAQDVLDHDDAASRACQPGAASAGDARLSVHCSDVTRGYGAVPALRGVSLAVAPGEFVAMLGPSGSGKTTLLRIIAGLDFPQSGRVAIDGRDMADVPARLRRVGFVFQHYALFRHMTVLENIGFGLRVRPRRERPSAAAIRARAAELLDLVQMPGLGDRYPDQLSGGQRQRVALARALAIEPRLLLLDEPFGALDARIRKDLRRWLRDLHKRMGLTSLFVTHDQDEAMELADRVAVMRAGRIEQIDTPARLHAAPANAFVHGFLGESARLLCHVQNGAAHFAPLPAAPVPTGCAEGPAVAVIRLHHIRLVPAVPDGTAAVRPRALHRSGPTVRVELDAGDQELEAVLPAEAPLPVLGAAYGLDLGAAGIYPLEREG